ncbi:probable disease resistance protein At4g14610 [Arabidopsis lyrata subsp. lyrata]|uniref:probable disease resistance protein At4g14610 n=1 Tax=Arabidopsis lyrata subsp. lyrata TaxID=81972 RepID=UPI000A29DFA8|nr:probable disease resistance protein At4g14610 [Arabidopsis lyrata subsp. lyrata]|eukprot:XP_020874215.1 probable disease resistance protein At4g14610 [Arabidopsis lyrata subsp. lyrata]
MGGCISVSVSCDQFVNQFSQWLCVRRSYIHSLTENLAALHKAMEVLKTKEDDVKRRVDREEFIGRRQRISQVQVWLTNVASIEKRFNDMVSTREVEIKRLCFCGFCSKSFGKSYGYGKMVSLMLKEVESLSSHGEFDVVTEVAMVVQVEEMPIQSVVVGQETMLERVWNSLMKDGFKIMGLYGMGGVGKTTLLTQINNKFSEMDCGFDIVMWVVVSKTLEIYRIQEDIAKRLGLSGEEWDKKTENKRAVDIHNVLRRKKFVLLLDDIWEKVNLESVRVPYPSRENGSIVAFTTRSRDVCGRMGVDDLMKVSCLEPEEAWDLFQTKVGENTLKSHPDIPELAKQVAEKCRGLPLALNVIGETMACKSTVQEWRHAIDVLTSSAIEFSGMEDEILPILKYSYDNLNMEHVKSCFLYCSLFPEDYEMKKEELVDYWICEGFIDVKDGKERAINEGYAIIGTLVRTCLLLEEGWKKAEVKMHDVVREMALWISSDLGKHKDQCIVRAGVGLHAVPEVKNWRAVRRLSLMKTELQNILGCPTCPELTTLLLQENHKLVNISGEFFRFMPNLVVLDLSWSSSLIGLPNQISELVSLRYLDLSYTNIERLPVGLQELKKLIHLNLESMKRLESIAGVSKLLSLRTLRLQKSKKAVDVNSAKELQLLEHLEVLTIDIFSSLVLEHLLCSQRLAKSIQYVELIEVEEESFKILTVPSMCNIRRIGIWKCGMKEIKVEMRTSSCFSSLSKVVIGQCNGLKDLTWLLFAPNLTYLYVRFAEQLEDIISEEKAASFTDENANIIIPFQKLECLSLSDLPKLKSIYWTPLSFPRLSELAVQEHCPKLKKLPLNSKSGTADVELVIKYGENKWLEGVEWEDKATELRFLATCKLW